MSGKAEAQGEKSTHAWRRLRGPGAALCTRSPPPPPQTLLPTPRRRSPPPGRRGRGGRRLHLWTPQTSRPAGRASRNRSRRACLEATAGACGGVRTQGGRREQRSAHRDVTHSLPAAPPVSLPTLNCTVGSHRSTSSSSRSSGVSPDAHEDSSSRAGGIIGRRTGDAACTLPER